MGRIGRWAAVSLLLAAGCSEWDQYWERDASPLGPDPVPDITPPRVRLVDPAGADSTGATAVGGSAYEVRIEASDDVRVDRVELRIDDGPALPVAGPPWRFLWDTTSLDEGSAHRLAICVGRSIGPGSRRGHGYAGIGQCLHRTRVHLRVGQA